MKTLKQLLRKLSKRGRAIEKTKAAIHHYSGVVKDKLSTPAAKGIAVASGVVVSLLALKIYRKKKSRLSAEDHVEPKRRSRSLFSGLMNLVAVASSLSTLAGIFSGSPRRTRTRHH